MLCRLIREAGFTPAQRNNTYDVVKLHDGPESPDLLVTDWSEHRAKAMHRETTAKGKQAGRASLTVSAART